MASFAVVEEDQLMLVTNQGQIIRIRVHGGEGDSIRIASRKTLGVRLFDVADDNDEKVVSAGLIHETDDEDEEHDAAEGEGSDDGGAVSDPETKTEAGAENTDNANTSGDEG